MRSDPRQRAIETAPPSAIPSRREDQPSPPPLVLPPAPEAASPAVQPPIDAGGAAKPAEGSAEKRPTSPLAFDVVRVTPEGEAVIAGRARPGAAITVMDGERELGNVVADSHGEWVLLPPVPLPPGGRELSLREAAPEDGGRIRRGDQVVVVVVPEPGRDIAGTPTDTPGGVLALAVPRDGGPGTVLQAPPPPPVSEPAAAEPLAAEPATADPATAEPTKPEAPVRAPAPSITAPAPPPPAPAPPAPPGGLVVETMDYDSTGQVALGGRSQPGSTVQLYLDNVLVGRAHTDPEGRWRLSPDRPVDPGIYRLRADQVIGTGKVTARTELPVQVSQVPPDMPPGTTVVVQPGNSLWRLARRTYGDGFQFTVIYQANREHIRDPDLIYPGQIFALPNKGPTPGE